MFPNFEPLRSLCTRFPFFRYFFDFPLSAPLSRPWPFTRRQVFHASQPYHLIRCTNHHYSTTQSSCTSIRIVWIVIIIKTFRKSRKNLFTDRCFKMILFRKIHEKFVFSKVAKPLVISRKFSNRNNFKFSILNLAFLSRRRTILRANIEIKKKKK